MKGSRKSCGKKSKPLKLGTRKNIAASLDRHFDDTALALLRLEPQDDEEPGHGDRREHGRQDADGECHGEAADRARAEPEHDDRGGKCRELAVEDRDERALEALLDRRYGRLARPQLLADALVD